MLSLAPLVLGFWFLRAFLKNTGYDTKLKFADCIFVLKRIRRRTFCRSFPIYLKPRPRPRTGSALPEVKTQRSPKAKKG